MKEITGARVLALFGDSITTDHISPAGNIKATAPAGVYLQEHQVAQKDFNSYGSRRGNHEVMERGTFANIRIRNEMMGGKEGGNTIYYRDANGDGRDRCRSSTPPRPTRKTAIGTVVIGGKEYGTGSSRDWAAKGPKLLGVRAVITESFERIHRSNLIGMGVAPFCFEAGKTRKDYGFTGREVIDIPGLSGDIKPRMKMEATIHRPDGSTAKLPLVLMILTADEVAYFKNGGILPYVLRNLVRLGAVLLRLSSSRVLTCFTPLRALSCQAANSSRRGFKVARASRAAWLLIDRSAPRLFVATFVLADGGARSPARASICGSRR